GANTMGTLVRIVLPVLMPAIVVIVLISAVNSLQAFEVEAVLGKPFGFNVYSTLIYELVRDEPPQFANASALSIIILLLSLPFIIWQRKVTLKKRYTTVGGQFKAQKIQLKKWRLPAYLFVALCAFLLTLLPIVMLVIGSFMKLFGFF